VTPPTGLFHRLVFRALAREPVRAALAVLAVALGVAVFLAIRLANRAAVASFDGFTRGIGTGADVTVQAAVGPLDQAGLARLEGLRRDAWIRPVLEGTVSRPGDREPLQVFATDLPGEPLPDPGHAQDWDTLHRLLADPAAVLVAPDLARAEGLAPGARLPGLVDGRPVELHVAGVLPVDPGRPALPRTLLVMDLPAAQRLFQSPGQLDRLDLGWLPGRDGAAARSRLAAALPPGWALVDPEHRAASARAMSAAFRLNLAVLSLIALAVGAYLLFQAFDALVERRRETWALLQALGCPPGRILALVLGEAVLVGAAGSLLGVVLGWALAQGAVRAVARTMAALYGAASAHAAAFHGSEAAGAVLAGLVTCLIAAWVPARRAALTPPVQRLARGSAARPLPWAPLALAGLALVGAGLAVAFLPHPPPGVLWPAYAGAALVLFGGSLATPALLPALGLPGVPAGAPWALRLALRPLGQPTGRHGFAAAALAVAVGMTVGMGVMVMSFEASVRDWIGSAFTADLYVAPLGAVGASARHRIAPEAADALAADPDVAAADRYVQVPLTFRGQPSTLAAGDLGITARFGHLAMVQGGASGEVLARIHRDGAADPGAVASETFARRFGLRVGDRLELPRAGAAQRVTLRGVYADYGNERGSLILDRPVFLAWFGDPRPSSLALYLKPGRDPEAVARRLAGRWPGLQARSNAALRARVVTIFRQTFAITYALEVIGLAVALGGLAQALAGLALARRGDLRTLRALGAGDRAVAGVLMGEGLGLALGGCLGGLGLGLLLARILVDVLNPQAFGWTLSFRLPWGFLAGLVAASLALAALALVPIARWAARLPVDRQAEEAAT
jgi:putative ABC transport system permease protein